MTSVDPLDLLKRRCSRCGLVKTWRDFPVRERWEDGSVRLVLSTCKACKYLLQRDWTARNLERARAIKSASQRRRRELVRHQRDCYLPAEPVREFLRATKLEDRMISEITGVSDRSLNRLWNGQAQIRLTTADQIITRLDGMFELVYPYEEEVDRAA